MDNCLNVIYSNDLYCHQLANQIKQGAESRNCKTSLNEYSSDLHLTFSNSLAFVVNDVNQVELFLNLPNLKANTISVIYVSKNSKILEWQLIEKLTQKRGLTVLNLLTIKLNGILKIFGRFSPLSEVDLARASAIGEKIAYSVSQIKPKSKDKDNSKTRIPGYVR